MRTYHRHFLAISLIVCLNSPAFAQSGILRKDSVGGRPFNIYLPPGYDYSEQRYPVIYFFRGMEDEWITSSQDGSRRGNIRTVIDTLLATGVIGHMIYVFPRMLGPTTLQSDFDYWIDELVPYIDQTYRTFPTRYHRAIDGFSNGGVMSTALTWAPHMIISVGAFEGVGGLNWGWYDSMLVNDASFRASWDALHFHYSCGDDPTQTNRQWVEEFVQYNYDHYGMTNSFDPVVLTPGAVHNWYYADLHASITIPRHWQIFENAPSHVSASISEPARGSRQSGTIPITYSVVTADTGILVYISSTRDEGKTWKLQATSTGPNGTVYWNTTNDPDGALYQLRIQVVGDSLFGVALGPGRFTIDNPGNAPPDAFITRPANPHVLSGTEHLSWVAGDADGDSVSLSLAFSQDGGSTWIQLGTHLALEDSLEWQTVVLPNTSAYLLRLTAASGSDTTICFSRLFSVSNERQVLSTAPAVPLGAIGDPHFALHVVDAGLLTGATYHLTFHTGTPGVTTYDVENAGTSQMVLSNAILGGSGEEGPPFDGLRLSISYVPVAVYDKALSGWAHGNSNLAITAFVPTFFFPGDTLSGEAYPADFALVMTDTISTTTISQLGAPIAAVPWYVYNLTDGYRPPVEYVDADMSGSLTHADEILIYDTTGSSMLLTWDLALSTPAGYTAPVAGDSFVVRIDKPIQDGDVFEISTAVVGITDQQDVPRSPTVHEVYPNPFNPSTTLSFVLSERSSVRISVINILGQVVTTIRQDDMAAGGHAISWRPEAVASGIYFIRMKIQSAERPDKEWLYTRKAVFLK